MRKICLLLAALTQPLPALAADKADAAKPVETLARTAKWNMNYADKACYLYGQFGSDNDQVILRLMKVLPGDAPRLALFGKRFDKLRGLEIPATVYFTPAQTVQQAASIMLGDTGTTAGRIKGIFTYATRLDNRTDAQAGLSALPPVTAEAEAAASGLHVEVRGLTPFELDLQSMGPPMAAMRQCTDNLVESWGFKPAELATRQRRATPANNPANWINSGDWPANIRKSSRNESFAFRLSVDEVGRVADCMVMGNTSPASLGPWTCSLIKKRGRFTPALDKSGKPVADFYTSRVNWITGL